MSHASPKRCPPNRGKASALSYLIAEHPGKASGLPILTIADNNVLSNYHNIFIPKAVQYSAGLLDYYFRGTLAVATTNLPDGTYDLYVTNTSLQDFGGGNFYLVKEDSAGVRTVVQTNALSGTLTNGGSTTINYPGSATNKFLVIYRGAIGVTSGTTNALDPVDAGIAIAVTNASCNCDGAANNINNLVWAADVGDGGSFSGSGASGSFDTGFDHIHTDSELDFSTSVCNPISSEVTLRFTFSNLAATSVWPYNQATLSLGDVVFYTGPEGTFSGGSTFIDVTIPAQSTMELDFKAFIPSFSDQLSTFTGDFSVSAL